MAALTNDQMEELLRYAAAHFPAVNYLKVDLRAALQAVEDTLTSGATKSAVGSAIEAAAPGKFSAARKDDIAVLWCMLNARRGGVL